jgi:hypothetical protein
MDEKDKARALRLLEEVYWLTKDQGQPVPASKLAITIGSSEAEAVAGLQDLEGRKLIDLHNVSGDVASATTTAVGSAFYENARKHPDQPLPGFGITYNNTFHIHNMGGGVQVAGSHSTQYQTTTYNSQDLADLSQAIDILAQHIDELKLDDAAKRKALAQVNTIKAQLSDEPNPTIIREAGRTLRSITEGAIGGLITEGIVHWQFVLETLTRIFST